MNEKVKLKPAKSPTGQSDLDEAMVPAVDSKKAGQVGQMLEGLALAYKKKYPDREVRWVYSPLHRGELSNVMMKRAQGYKPVLVKDIGSLDGFEPEDRVRIGDCILMSIPAEKRRRLEAEVKERADEQLKQVEQDYYDKVSNLDAREGAEPRMRPAGRAVIEERDREYEIKQRDKED